MIGFTRTLNYLCTRKTVIRAMSLGKYSKVISMNLHNTGVHKDFIRLYSWISDIQGYYNPNENSIAGKIWIQE